MKKFYAAIGIFKLQSQDGKKTYPSVILSGEECKLDVQEMMIWASINWRILTLEQLKTYYDELKVRHNLICSRSFEDTLNRLMVRGLIAEGIGETDEDALYNLISKLYIIPLYDSTSIRMISFLKLIFIHKVPFEKAKIIFKRDKKTKKEKQIMSLAFSAPMITAEIIKCVDKNINCILCEDDIVEFLYDEHNITNDNIADYTRNLPSTRSVITAIINLYMRQQILFERVGQYDFN